MYIKFELFDNSNIEIGYWYMYRESDVDLERSYAIESITERIRMETKRDRDVYMRVAEESE